MTAHRLGRTATLAGLILAALAGAAFASGAPESGAAAGARSTEFPSQKGAINLSFFSAEWQGYGYLPLGEMPVFKELEAKTNVTVTWEVVPSSASGEKVNLKLASGDLPDVFFGTSAGGTTGDLLKYGQQGMFLQLEGLIDRYAPNLKAIFAKRDYIRRLVTQTDGHVYSLPFVQEYKPFQIYSKAYINSAWLAKLGLAMPKTTEELATVLVAFRDRDPNGNGKKDEIPLSFVNNNHNKGLYGLFGAFGITFNQAAPFMIRDGKTVYVYATPEYRNGIRYFARLYKEGLIDQEAFTHNNSQFMAKGKTPDPIMGVFLDMLDPQNQVGPDRAKDFAALPPLKGPQGHQLWDQRFTRSSAAMFIVTNKNKYPEITIRWSDLLYDQTMAIQIPHGPVGFVLREEGGKLLTNAPPQGRSATDFLYTYSPVMAPTVVLAETYDRLVPDAVMKFEQAVTTLYEPYLVKEFVPPLKFSVEQNARVAALSADLNTLNATMFAKWISGAADVDADWERYQADLKRMGVEELAKLQQEAYDTYLRGGK